MSELLRTITNISLGRYRKVKWLVTSCKTPEIEWYLQPDSCGVKVSLKVKTSHVRGRMTPVSTLAEMVLQQCAVVKLHLLVAVLPKLEFSLVVVIMFTRDLIDAARHAPLPSLHFNFLRPNS